MRTAFQRPLIGRQQRDDRGFTLVELIMALSILAVGIFGVMPVFLAGLRTGAVSASRSRALALATRDIESFHSLPYCSVGFGPGQTGYTSSPTWNDPADHKNYTTVTIANPLVDEKPPSGPSQTVGGQSYQFERHIVWATTKSPDGKTTYGSASPGLGAYKRIVEIVTWSDQVGSHSARQDSDLYPGGLGAYSAGNCGASGGPGSTAPPAPVTGLTATTAVSPQGQTEIDLSWTLPTPMTNVDKYRIVYSFDNFATSHTITSGQSPTSTSYQVTGLAPGVTYGFQVYTVSNATGSEGSSGSVSATTLTAPPSAGCTVGAVTVTPGGADQVSGGTTLATPSSGSPVNVVVSANTTGTCGYLQLVYTTVEGDPASKYAPMTQGQPGTWTGSMDGMSTNWSVGTHTVLVEDGSGNILVQASFTVCSSGRLSCP
jgi:prepilin-type N-terminal cleavage/methylation domain-containing protein